MTQISSLSPRGSHLVRVTQEQQTPAKVCLQGEDQARQEPRTRASVISPCHLSGSLGPEWAGQTEEAVLGPAERPQGRAMSPGPQSCAAESLTGEETPPPQEDTVICPRSLRQTTGSRT